MERPGRQLSATADRAPAPFGRGGRVRFGWLDAAILALVALAVAFIVYRVDSVLNYRWNWQRVFAYVVRWDAAKGEWVANLLVQGFWTTVRLSLWGILLAGIVGLFLGLARTATRLLPRLVSRTYVELVRNVPPLVFMFIFYFFISSQIMPLLGIAEWVRRAGPTELAAVEFLFGSPRLLSNFVSGLICLAMFEAAYVTEIVRAGLQSIEKGQWEAAESLGLKRYDRYRYVILPQAVQRILPPLANQFITLIKTSSIVSLISVQELTFLAVEVAVTTQRIFEIWILVAGFYFVISYTLSLAFARLERRMAAGRR